MRCQSVGKPLTAEYWCMGATTTRFFRVSCRRVIGVKSRGWLIGELLWVVRIGGGPGPMREGARGRREGGFAGSAKPADRL